MDDKDFKPIIKSTLRDKEVTVKDTMKFDRRTGLQSEIDKRAEKQKAKEKEKEKQGEEHRKTTMKTQKMSLDLLLRLDILDPFLRSAENIDHDGKISINDKIDLLLEYYIENKLTRRQIEGFQAIFDAYTGE